MLKKIDKLIATSFIGPTILSYFIATFVLVMQFLWKYIDEILGKGFTILEMLELIMYYAITLIPLAVPITILIASVMVFGDLSEKYELSSMKSAGVSLVRTMLPGFIIAVLIGLYSLFASNFLKPAANLQFQKRLISLRKQKSALAIEEGIFNEDFGETIIRIKDIDDDGRGIHDVLLYDHTQNNKSLMGVLSAKGGEMYTMDEGRYFVMQLDTGVQYRELERKYKSGSTKSEIPFTRTYFDQWTKKFDMNQFNADDGALNFNRNREDMMNSSQLMTALDTFNKTVRRNIDKMDTRMSSMFKPDSLTTKLQDAIPTQSPFNTAKRNVVLPTPTTNPTVLSAQKNNIKDPNPTSSAEYYKAKALDPARAYNGAISNDSLRKLKEISLGKLNQINKDKIADIKNQKTNKAFSKKDLLVPPVNIIGLKEDKDGQKKIIQLVDTLRDMEILTKAMTDLSNVRDEFMTMKNVNYDYNRMIQKHRLRLHQQFSWATICVIFLLIGAPLGSIIRKGGYGYPLLVAILFYMIFIITTIFGEKLVKNGTMEGIHAAWLPCLLLSPFALGLTIMALRDIKFNFHWISSFFSKYFQKST